MYRIYVSDKQRSIVLAKAGVNVHVTRSVDVWLAEMLGCVVGKPSG
jgi:hypothetical protein